MSLEVRPLSDALGVELVGLDLRADHPEDIKALAAEALERRHLVLVRGQELELADQMRFVRWFGSVNTGGRHPGLEVTDLGRPEMFISNTRPTGVAGEGSLQKHQDYCSQETLLPWLCLFAEEVPEEGGDT